MKAPRDEARRPDGHTDDAPAPGSRKRALLIFGLVLVAAALGGVSYWLHARQFEDTDDAQVDGNLSPIGTRIDGTVIRVYVQNNQAVKVGDPLVDLDASDNQVALDQALAQLAQARSLLSSERPTVPITEVQNSTNIASARADVASAEAALAAAERDRDQAASQVVQQEAANTKAQSDLKRYTRARRKAGDFKSRVRPIHFQRQAAGSQPCRSEIGSARRRAHHRPASRTARSSAQ